MHNVHYAYVTAHDSIDLGHVKKCLFGNFGSDVQARRTDAQDGAATPLP